MAVVLAGALVMGEEPAGDDPAAPPSPLTAEDLQQAPAGSGHGAAASRGDPGEPPAAPDEGRAAPKLHARAALLTRELVTGQVDGDTMRYVDLAVTEHVTREGAVAVAVVSAYVLEGTPQRWDEGRTERYALALRDDGGLLAGPWPLDTAEEDVRTPRWDAADHEHAAVEQALADAGYEEVALGDVTASTELPGLIRVVARARGPGASAVESHELLLRDGDPPALLGSDRPSPPSPSPEREPLTSTEQTP